MRLLSDQLYTMECSFESKQKKKNSSIESCAIHKSQLEEQGELQEFHSELEDNS